MDQAILEQAARAFALDLDSLRPAEGGNFAAVFEAEREDNGTLPGVLPSCVLRVIPPNDEALRVTPGSVRSGLAWLSHLASHGAAVTRPLLARSGELVEAIERPDGIYQAMCVEHARGVLAQTLPASAWQPQFYYQLGQATGRMHALATQYEPADESLRRPEWTQAGNCFNPVEQLDDSQAIVRQRREAALSHVLRLPRQRSSYGLIHTDLHMANIFVDVSAGYRVTLLDFDDCSYGWYMMDVAMPLFDALVVNPAVGGGGPRGGDGFAATFLAEFLRGYRTQKSLDPAWLTQLPYFLKLLEIGVYTQVCAAWRAGELGWWVDRFMPTRRWRIENDVPYLEVGD